MTAQANDELRIRILDGAAKMFDEKGIRFTMDDLARSLGMSKKTIYLVFKDKRSIMTETIDRFFDEAFETEKVILADDSQSITEQLRLIISSVPERYAGHDLSQLYVLKEKYPAVYKHWHKCRDEYWNGADELIKKGIEQGEIRPVSMPILKTLFQSTIEQFFQSDILIKNKIAYKDALKEVASILIDGIIIR